MDIDRASDNALAKAVKSAELDGAARMLEKMEKILLSELVNQSGESSISKAEHWARRHERFKAHIVEMVEARTAAMLPRPNGKQPRCGLKHGEQSKQLTGQR